MSIIQIALLIFLFFALSRVILRFRSSEVSLTGFIFWFTIFGTAIIFAVFPELTSIIARSLHIGRGVDTVVYISIAILFYLVFRLYVYLQDIRHEITDIIKEIALRELEKSNAKKNSNN